MKKIVTFIVTLISISFYSQSNSVTSLPITLEGNSIYIYCKVNERDSLKFLFDTGADGTVINKSSLQKVNLTIDGKSLNVGSNGQNEVESSSKNELILGTIKKNEVFLTIIPFGTDAFDGILGINMMKEHIIEIDYDRGLIKFYAEDDKNINLKGYTKLKMYSDIYPTYIKSTISVGGKKFKGLFGLDTGADDALTLASPFVRKNDFTNKGEKVGLSRSEGSDGSVYESIIIELPEIEFAGKHLYNIPASLSNSTEGIDSSDKLAGFYGNAVLRKFNMIIDYKNHLIYFKLNQNLYSDFYNEW